MFDHDPLHLVGFLIALIAACLTGLGARDQILLAQLTHASGPRISLLVTAVATTSVAAAIAAWAGSQAGSRLTPPMQLALTAIALAIAGGQLLPVVRMRALKEPTNSLGAAAIVLFAYQIADAGRLSILAIAVLGSASQAAMGGALGSAVALAIGWRSGGHCLGTVLRLRRERQAFGVILILIAVAVALMALRF